MAETKLAPLSTQVPIVDKETGNPTPYFQQLMQIFIDEKNAVADSTIENVQDLNDLVTVVANLELDDLTDVDTTTTPPADGDGLVYDNGSSLWVPGTIASSGSWTPTPPVAADFTTIRNGLLPAPTIAAVDKGIGVKMSYVRNSTGSSWRQGYILQPAPSVPFRVEALYSYPWSTSNNWHMFGLAISSTNAADAQKHLRAGMTMDANVINGICHKLNGINSIETGWTTNPATTNGAAAALDTVFWAAIEWDGTNIKAYFSHEGYSWWHQATEPDSFFAQDPDLIGFGCEAVASDGGTQIIHCPHFHVTTDLTEPFGLNRV